MGRYYEDERRCEECGERFWGTAKANFCSTACRSRAWRKQRAERRAVGVAELCAQVLERRKGAQASPSKLYPRLFRALAVELRKLGWDPIELLMSWPDEPATDEGEEAPGGIEGSAPNRRRWLHAPADEIERLRRAIEERQYARRNTVWYEARLAQLERWMRMQSAANDLDERTPT
jgi:hypothetical protein